MPDLDADTLATIAQQPASGTQDGRSATMHPLKDIQAVADKQAADAALDGVNANGGSKSGWGGLRAARAVPPGAA